MYADINIVQELRFNLNLKHKSRYNRVPWGQNHNVSASNWIIAEAGHPLGYEDRQLGLHCGHAFH